MISMMTNESSGQILLLLTCLLSVSTELICPDAGFIGSSAEMSCSGGTISHDYINPSGRNVAQCLLTGERCDVDPSMFTSVLNATHTTLTIGRVQLSDAGTWKCVTGSGEATCHLSVASIPARQITCPRDTSSLRIGEDLLLNISISRYYCSDTARLRLLMGKNDITLLNETVNGTTKEYFVVKQRMTASHFGIVKLFFECGNFREALLCEGVQLLSLKYDDSCRCDETGSTLAIVMGIVIIVIIVLLLVKNLRNKNDGCKGCSILQVEMCSIIRCLPWFKRNPNNQVQKHMEADDLQIQVSEKTMPAEDPKPEVPPKPMPAEDQIPEVSKKTVPAEETKPEVAPKPMSAEDQIPEEIHSKTSSSTESTI
ncbi:uncharacterized protein LOC124129494 [Haliotis rufescens]|uniref:uncharacterized protein LOC124129494 n=1 Tax=Haliotis rufescens TaxID=6454 RepID=UPI00201E7CAC|nr:uncharacterized protein LOC124129494 [Haliotis rufescens]XP_048242968.1 uncharacterized protein LOC124129494 [Haliotis rufescens]